jgi:hypothetical protein
VGRFLSVIAVLAIIAGLSILGHASNAVQEIEGILFLGFGFLILGFGGVLIAISDVSSILKGRLPIPKEPEPIPKEPEPKKSWKDWLFQNEAQGAHSEESPGSQLRLGRMYAIGQGVPQDYVQAHMLLSLAAARAKKEANRAMVVKERNELAAKMTPDQIAEAQRLARASGPRSEPWCDARSPIAGSNSIIGCAASHRRGRPRNYLFSSRCVVRTHAAFRGRQGETAASGHQPIERSSTSPQFSCHR